MLFELDPARFERARPLYDEMDYNLAALAVLAGSEPGRLWVDDAGRPHCALLQAGRRFYLAGDPGREGFGAGLRALIVDEVYPQSLAAGEEEFVLYYAPPAHAGGTASRAGGTASRAGGTAAWADAIEAQLGDREPLHYVRHYYQFQGLRHDWRRLVPPGFELRAVDEGLLADGSLDCIDELRAEVVSECPSVEFFVENRFGVCLVGDGVLAAWCLSEHNLGGRCEVGIETGGEYRRQGLATTAASALVEAALARDVNRIGWHCYETNPGSIATALAVGFQKAVEYPAYLFFFEPVLNYSVHGNVSLRDGRYEEAASWYARAFAAGEAPDWAYLGAACACARAGELDAGLGYLREAVARGIDDGAYLRGLESLQALHGTAGWQTLMASLS